MFQIRKNIVYWNWLQKEFYTFQQYIQLYFPLEDLKKLIFIKYNGHRHPGDAFHLPFFLFSFFFFLVPTHL